MLVSNALRWGFDMTVNLLITPEKMTWAQFREVEPSANEAHHAQTASTMQPGTIRIGKSGKGLRITQLQINVSLDSAGCWVVRGKQTDALLAHERLHYRIAIVVAYELDAALLAISAPNASALQAAANRETSARQSRVDALSRRYDSETKHGLDAAAQRRWEVQVASWQQHKKAS
jgi:hypothetical protein